MECGADVNASNKWGWTPLHFAATNGMTETALRLVQLGANLYAMVRRRRRSLDVTALSSCRIKVLVTWMRRRVLHADAVARPRGRGRAGGYRRRVLAP